MTTLPEAKPRRPSTRPSDLIVELKLKCPCGCGHEFVRHVPILVEPHVRLERDEFGMLVKDDEGNAKPKIRQSYEYDQIPVVHPSYDPEMEDEYRILSERAEEEKKQAALLTIQKKKVAPEMKDQ